MILAKVTSLNPAQMTYKDPQDHRINIIAEVENVTKGNEDGLPSDRWICINKEYFLLSLNQQVFIEPTTEGKCKIVRL